MSRVVKWSASARRDLAEIVRFIAEIDPTAAERIDHTAAGLATFSTGRAGRVAGPQRIAVRHILPNVASPIIVATTLSIGNIMLAESVLSLLGLGIQPPLPSWGNMLTNAQEIIWQVPALAIWPGALLFATVIACNILGDGLQDALDPRGDGH